MKKTKKLLSIILSVLMVVSALPMTVFANDTVAYIDRAWDGSEVVEIERQITNYELVTSSTTTMAAGTFYVVSGDVTVPKRIVVEGTKDMPTYIILTDGCILNSNYGIQLHSGNVLNIFGQTNDTGKIIISTNETGVAAIGGNSNCSAGELTVYGGDIYAKGGYNASGIGGGREANGGKFTMYGGTVEAKSTKVAGIGAGRLATQHGSFKVYGDVSVDIDGTETTVSEYSNTRNGHVIITQNKEHIWKAVNPVSPVRCTKTADCDIECSVCHETKSVVLALADTHFWRFDSTSPATCTKAEAVHRECVVCHTKKDFSIGSPNGHSREKILVSPATCAVLAVYKDECSICHDYYTYEEGDLLCHNFVDGHCTVCGQSAYGFVECRWSGSEVKKTYKTLNDGSKCQVVTANTTAFEDGVYYIARGNITNQNRIVAKGTVHLILEDGCNFNAKKGIEVTEGAKLNIYGQNENTGKIIAFSENSAAIGGNSGQISGSIVIHGGILDATVSGGGAAIGGTTRAGSITVYNGDITAKSPAGAAIGGGAYGEIADINIYSGDFHVASENGACIGAGNRGSVKTVNIYGGDFHIESIDGSGIGSGYKGSAQAVNIYDGVINARCTGRGTGVGAGDTGSVKALNIYGGVINATNTDCGGGVGVGWGSTVEALNIFGGTITAKVPENIYSRAVGANRIFLGMNVHAQYGKNENRIQGELDVTSDNASSILNDSKYAYLYLQDGALIPITYLERDAASAVYKTITDYEIVTPVTTKFENNKYYVLIQNVNTENRIKVSGTAHLILLDGKTFNAEYGICVDEGNKLYIYGQCNDSGILNAGIGIDTSASRAIRNLASIGSSANAKAGDIAICGGTINAGSDQIFGAGIGGSEWQTHGYIDIFGGNVTARSYFGAGIGAGDKSDGNRSKAISIYGGTVYASSEYGAGISAGSPYGEGNTFSTFNIVAGHGGLVKFYGGSVTVQSSDGSAIGSGRGLTKTAGSESRTYFGNPAVLYMDPSIELHYGNDEATATKTLKTTSISQNVGSNVDRYHYITYKTTTPEITHDWQEATCIAPKTCKACGKKNGTSLGHDIVNASCTEPKHCSRCDLTIGSPLGHNWVVKSCYQPRECANCGEKEDYTYGHDFRPYEKVEDQESYPDTYKAKCVNCGDLIDYMSYKESYSKEEDVNFEDVYEYDTFKPGIKIAPVNNGEAGTMIVSVDGVETTVNADEKFTVPYCTECSSKNVDSDGTMYLMLTTVCTFTYPTCQNIPECIFCGNTAGKKDGHTWVDATCTEPRKCFFCDLTEGEALGHSYTELGRLISYETCTSPAIYAAECERCHEENGTIELGEPLGHDYIFVSSSSDGFVKNYRCFRCDDSYTVDKTVLAAVIEIANDEYINNDLANKMYSNISQLKFMVALGNAILDSETATQDDVDSIARTVQNAINNVKLKTYSVTVNKIVDDDIADTETVTVEYGEMFNYFVELDENQAIYKWVMETEERDVKLNTITQDLSQVITGDVTFNCYIDNSDTKAEDTARVVFYDKGNRVISLDYVTIGSSISYNVEAPKVAFYDFIGWETVSGDPTNVDKSGVSFRAMYAPKDIEANKSTIVAIGDIKVNGKQTTTEFYDTGIELTGADSYAYCDADGNILQGINGNVIYAPNNSQTIYVCAGTSNEASTSITGVIDEANRLTINAQYYLPSDCTVVEAGIVISKTNENPTINGTGCQSLKSSQQGPSGEYSISLKHSTAGTINAVSYLTYKDSQGTLHTVYSDAQSITYGA